MNPNYPELFVRNSENPILTASMWPYPVHTVFNPGATILKDGNTLLLCRMEDRKGLSQLGIARSKKWFKPLDNKSKSIYDSGTRNISC